MFELVKTAVFAFLCTTSRHNKFSEKPRIVGAQRCRAENFYHTNVQRAHEEIDFLPHILPPCGAAKRGKFYDLDRICITMMYQVRHVNCRVRRQPAKLLKLTFENAMEICMNLKRTNHTFIIMNYFLSLRSSLKQLTKNSFNFSLHFCGAFSHVNETSEKAMWSQCMHSINCVKTEVFSSKFIANFGTWASKT